MSRSKRYTPIIGITTARSEREDKRQWHGSLRAMERAYLATGRFDDLHDNDYREVSSPWSMQKDGKQYLLDANPKWLRK